MWYSGIQRKVTCYDALCCCCMSPNTWNTLHYRRKLILLIWNYMLRCQVHLYSNILSWILILFCVQMCNTCVHVCAFVCFSCFYLPNCRSHMEYLGLYRAFSYCSLVDSKLLTHYEARPFPHHPVSPRFYILCICPELMGPKHRLR